MNFLIIEDGKETLRRLGHLWVRCFDIPQIAVTGSTGKGSTVEMIRYIFAQKFLTLRTKIWASNQPQVELFRLTDEYQISIVEAAAGGPICNTRNSRLIQPNVAVFTNVDYVHLTWSKTDNPLEEMYQAKIKLLDNLAPTGRIYVDGNNEYYKRVKTRAAQTLRMYGLTSDMDFYAENIIYNSDWTTSFDLCTGKERINIHMPMPGKHLVLNACAAAAVAYDFGFSLQEIKSGLEMCRLEPGRNNVLEQVLSVTLIDDSTVAAPIAAKAAVDMLTDYHPEKRKVIFCSDMVDVGNLAVKLHEDVARYINSHNVDVAIFAGEYSKQMANQFKSSGKTVLAFDNADEVVSEVENIVEDGDVVLVEASHRYHFNVIVDKIKELYTDYSDLKNLEADCAAIFDLTTDKYVYKKNVLKSYTPCATVQILTALVTLENANLDDVIEVPEDIAKRYGFDIGEKFLVKDCLAALLVGSYNIMADILAIHVCGDIKSFVQKMNDFAGQIDMRYSTFADVFGGTIKNVTCIADMIKLCKYAFANKIFMDIIAYPEYVFKSSSKEYKFTSRDRTLLKDDEFYNENSLGGKTGTIAPVFGMRRIHRHSYVNFFRHNGHVYLTIQGALHWANPLNDRGLYNGGSLRFIDAERMYQYIVHTTPASEPVNEIAAAVVETKPKPVAEIKPVVVETKTEPVAEVKPVVVETKIEQVAEPIAEKKTLPEKPFFNFTKPNFA